MLDWKVAESAEAAVGASTRPEAELDYATTAAVMMLSTSAIAASMLF